MLVRDAELDGARLTREVLALLDDPERLERMRQASRELGRPDAARRVAELLKETASRGSERRRALTKQEHMPAENGSRAGS